ncbi:hypothetical protein [Marinoscillum sp.]|uniref:hypothetical protein n=1 Tax=Marinoscillum sp. TaxID=2024838 RepID=UPI003BAB7AD3
MFKNNWFIACAFLIPVILTTGCSDKDVPDAENEEEIITKVQLIFSPAEGAPVVVTALDPDGDGPEDIAPSGPVVLAKGTEYELFIKLENTISNEDITEEVEAEGDEHLFFFGFSEGIFNSPAGNGNLDSRADVVNYLDKDVNNLPVGLITAWITGEAGSGTFRVMLKHQPGIKSTTSESTDGESDVDITWTLNIQD